MVPLPFRLEHALSRPLQHAATRISCWILQCLGQPALSEGNIIFLGDQRLEVAQACSGLRIFVGIVALAFVFVVLVRRTWWEKTLLVVCIVPDRAGGERHSSRGHGLAVSVDRRRECPRPHP